MLEFSQTDIFPALVLRTTATRIEIANIFQSVLHNVDVSGPTRKMKLLNSLRNKENYNKAIFAVWTRNLASPTLDMSFPTKMRLKVKKVTLAQRL